jgi:hypothetical protein
MNSHLELNLLEILNATIEIIYQRQGDGKWEESFIHHAAESFASRAYAESNDPMVSWRGLLRDAWWDQELLQIQNGWSSLNSFGQKKRKRVFRLCKT